MRIERGNRIQKITLKIIVSWEILVLSEKRQAFQTKQRKNKTKQVKNRKKQN